ncbi:hypothetical protein [Actinocorallia libanotica]|uniref:Ig-like domain-containing protein n=1 Tax=Actinocorallia libanotica TaxID=46162 RepID=A0ABN1RVY6_9ACTN
MSRISRTAVTTAAAFAAVAFAPSPASAWTGGAFSASVTSPVNIQMGIQPPVTCPSSSLSGTITASGALSITTATFSGCTLSNGAPVPITAQGLPWSGSLNSTAALAGVKLSITFPTTSGPLPCSYTSNLSGTAGGSTPPIPVPVSGTLGKTGGSFLCPTSLPITATYLFTGPGL